jgi:hypothetical protein
MPYFARSIFAAVEVSVCRRTTADPANRVVFSRQSQQNERFQALSGDCQT